VNALRFSPGRPTPLNGKRGKGREGICSPILLLLKGADDFTLILLPLDADPSNQGSGKCVHSAGPSSALRVPHEFWFLLRVSPGSQLV